MVPTSVDPRHAADLREAGVAAALVALGWLVSAACLSVTFWLASLHTAFAVHGFALPVVLSLVALVYFRREEAMPPLRAALLFAVLALVLEVVLSRFLASRSYEPLTSAVGTWIPVLLVFFATWLIGIGAHEPSR